MSIAPLSQWWCWWGSNWRKCGLRRRERWFVHHLWWQLSPEARVWVPGWVGHGLGSLPELYREKEREREREREKGRKGKKDEEERKGGGKEWKEGARGERARKEWKEREEGAERMRWEWQGAEGKEWEREGEEERKEGNRGGRYGEGAVTPLAWFTHLALKFIAIHCLGCRQKEKTRDDAQSRKVLITKHWLKFFNFKLHLCPKCTRSYINHWKSLKDDKHGSLAKWSCSSL